MREIKVEEVMAVGGGELSCSVGVPSGVSCEGTLSDWKSAGGAVWDFLAASPFKVPGLLTRIF